MSSLHVFLAHQGGWDEILLFAAPVILAIWVVRRVERRGRDEATDSTETPDPQPSDAD